MIYEIIKSLRPYFHSLREIDDNLSLDMKFPTNWQYEYDDESIQVISQDKNDKVNLVSFITPSTKEGYEAVISVVKGIIRYNMEQEEKAKLFQQKITELKELFIREPLDKLKEIKFEEYGRAENSPSTGMAGQGNEEGSKGD